MSEKQRRIFWPTLSVAALVSLTLVLAAPRIRSAAQSEPAAAQSRPVSAAQSKPPGQVPKERVEMVQITVRPTGFEPAEIEYPPKPFLLAVDNQSGMDSLELELFQEEREGKTRAKIRDLSMSPTSFSKREITVLKTGRYVLREVSHPDWVCHVTIGPE